MLSLKDLFKIDYSQFLILTTYKYLRSYKGKNIFNDYNKKNMFIVKKIQ